MHLFLGDIPLGVSSVLTGPTGTSETRSNTLSEHKVITGKPVLQDGGEELDTRTFDFFFDESFCDVEAEYRKLTDAAHKRTVLPLVTGSGRYRGKRYAITSLSVTEQKTTARGRLVRMDASLELIEVSSLSLSFGGAGPAASLRAIINPLLKVFRP